LPFRLALVDLPFGVTFFASLGVLTALFGGATGVDVAADAEAVTPTFVFAGAVVMTVVADRV
jgi:hypothetical protein